MNKHENAEIVVIGGGAVGTAVACYLARDGADVALVERAADKSGKLRREITVDQIRALAVDAAVLPNEADGKVYIFPEADTMNIAAQNAFLKLLEEPPRGVMFLLCAESREKLLETEA